MLLDICEAVGYLEDEKSGDFVLFTDDDEKGLKLALFLMFFLIFFYSSEGGYRS